MSLNEGVLVIASVRPNDSLDQYPTAYANEILGGWKQVADTTERDAIPTLRLTAGTVCYVNDIAALFLWNGSAWVPYDPSGAILSGALASGANTVDSLLIAAVGDALWEVCLVKTTNRYSSVLRANHDGTTANWTELSDVFSPPAGTFDFITGVSISGANMNLTINTSSTGWAYRIRRRTLPV